MKNPFEGLFNQDSEKEEREKAHSLIMNSVNQLQNYLNMDFYKDLLEPKLIASSVPTLKLEELATRIQSIDSEELRKVLDEWLIENEDTMPIIASARNKSGLKKNQDGTMQYPNKMKHPEASENEDFDEEGANIQKEDYVRRMKSALSILDEDFDKQKLDMLYCDTGANPEFDLTLSKLEKDLAPLIERERKEKIKEFLAELRA